MLQPPFAVEEVPSEGADAEGEEDDEEEGLGGGAEPYVDVHAVEARHQGRDHKNEGDAGHGFHDVVDVVGNHRGVGVHTVGENLHIHVDGVRGLRKLDFDILHEVGVAVGLEHLVEPLDEHAVALQGGVEVHERLLQLHEVQEYVITHAAG